MLLITRIRKKRPLVIHMLCAVISLPFIISLVTMATTSIMSQVHEHYESQSCPISPVDRNVFDEKTEKINIFFSIYFWEIRQTFHYMIWKYLLPDNGNRGRYINKDYCISGGKCTTAYEVFKTRIAPKKDLKTLGCQYRSHPFAPVLQPQEVAILLDLIRVFTDAAQRINATYFLHSGTLIGALRHQGFIPWDDDFDVMVDIKKKRQLVSILSQMAPEYRMGGRSNGRFKLFSVNGQHYKDIYPGMLYEYTWPYVDIFFYDIKDNFLVDDDVSEAFSRRASLFFPVRFVPFLTFTMPVPNRAEEIFENSMHDCLSTPYNHKEEKVVYLMYSIPCHKLFSLYNFKEQI